MKKRSLLVMLFLFISFSLFGQEVKIKLVETSDVHGAIYPYDLLNDRPGHGSLARVTSYLKDLKTENSNVILLDNGDILQGTPAVYYYNFEKTDVPHLYAEVMNYMNYDAATIGNHDIEAGHDVYDRFRETLEAPLMAANAIDDNTDEPYFKPYTVIEKEGVKVAVLGLITPHIPHWLPKALWSGMHFTDMVESANKWVKIIEEKENPDVLVGLFHAGADFTYNNPEKTEYLNENASMLVAEQVPGFDLIFVGHDHKGWNEFVTGPEGKPVMLMGTRSRASDVAEVTVTFNKETGEAGLVGNIVQMDGYEPDEEFMAKFGPQLEEVKKYVNRPIGEFISSVSTRDAMFGDSEFSDLIHKVQLDITGADVSFTAPLSFNSYIDKGEVYVRDMFKLYKYENMLYKMNLTGEEIKNYMEYSYSRWFDTMKNSEDHLLNFKRDENGEIVYSDKYNSPVLAHPYYNFDSAEGIEYTVDVSKEPGERIKIETVNGEPFDENKTYSVAVNSYRGNGGGGHLTDGAGIDHDKLAGRIIFSTDKDLRYYMMKWIEKEKTVTPEVTGNWNVIPDEWYEAAREKDYKLLYGEK